MENTMNTVHLHQCASGGRSMPQPRHAWFLKSCSLPQLGQVQSPGSIGWPAIFVARSLTHVGSTGPGGWPLATITRCCSKRDNCADSCCCTQEFWYRAWRAASFIWEWCTKSNLSTSDKASVGVATCSAPSHKGAVREASHVAIANLRAYSATSTGVFSSTVLLPSRLALPLCSPSTWSETSHFKLASLLDLKNCGSWLLCVSLCICAKLP